MIRIAWNGLVWSLRSFPELWSVTIISAAFTGAILLAGVGGYPGEADGSCHEDENGVVIGYCFCERDTGGLIRQPLNSASNFAFVVAGMIIGWDAGRRRLKKNKDKEEHISEPEREYINIMDTLYYPILYSNVLASVGPASIALHASLKVWGGKVDMIFVIMLLNLIFSVSFGRLLGPRFLEIPTFSIMISITTIVTQVLNAKVHTSYFMMAGLGFAGIFIEALHLCCRRIKINKLIFAASVFLVLTAGVLRIFDDGSICDPDSFFQVHALWHALAALSGLLLYFYICTEVPPLKDQQTPKKSNRRSTEEDKWMHDEEEGSKANNLARIDPTDHTYDYDNDEWMDEEAR